MDILDKDDVPTREFYIFLRYNQIVEKAEVKSFSDQDERRYAEFCRHWSELAKNLQNGSSSGSSSNLGSIATMFGFNRHYCSISGLPIIGKYYKLGSKIVSKEAYESYEIIQEMEKVDNSHQPFEQKPPKKEKD